jgi:hypothetical protein
MNIRPGNTLCLLKPREEGSLVAYLIFLLLLASTIAAVSTFVSNSIHLAHRRSDMYSALEYAQGGAVIAAREVEQALTNRPYNFFDSLTRNPSGPYTLKKDTSEERMYERTITSPFSNQTVTAQLWMTNSPSPQRVRIVTASKVGKVSQISELNVKMTFGYGAAIVSDNPGTSATGVGKGVAHAGNVVVDGGRSGPTVIDGGPGLAIWANGRVNTDNPFAPIPDEAISMQDYGTADEIPDYTAEGSSDQLFDFNRYIAAADVAKTHYTNLGSFFAANNAASSIPNGALEGIIVVDIWRSDRNFGNLDPRSLPKGINVRGTLIFNFSSEFGPMDKIVNTATININAANLAGVNPADPNTYTTGYPPKYSDATKNPTRIDITPLGFPNFLPIDDLPALMYNIGILDIHGSANICGVVYTPSFVEIENKQDGQTQYFRGSIIGGGGIFVENGKRATSIVGYDPGTLDYLATSSNKGKRVVTMFWK